MSTLVSNTIKPRRGDTVTFADCNISVGGTATYEDVTNIDSIGIITARSDIKVSGIVTAMTGTAVTYHGDGSKLTGIEFGVENFVASGTIDNGKTVVLNTNGTVGIVTQTTVAPSAGTPVGWGNTANNLNTYGDSSVYIGNNKIFIAYQDTTNSNQGTGVIGEISGTTINFGSPAVFGSSTTWYISSTYDSTNDRVVVAYRDQGDFDKGKCAVGTISGTTVNFPAAPVTFNNSSSAYISATYDYDNDRVLIGYVYADVVHAAKVIAGIVDTNTNTVNFNSGGEGNVNVVETYDVTATYVGNSKVVVNYRDAANSHYGRAIVGSITGAGTSTVDFASGAVTTYNEGTTYNASRSAVYNSDTGTIIICYQAADVGASQYYGTASIGVISGNTITFGNPSDKVVFDYNSTSDPTPAYDSTNKKVIINYRSTQPGGGSSWAYARVVSAVGTAITFTGSPILLENTQTEYLSAAYVPGSDKTVCSYVDLGSGYNYGRAVVLSPESQTTNVTTENYIGIAAETISDTSTGKVNVLGGVNSGQSGLTTAQTYYVAQTGILTTTADTPSVVAGTSISSTEILIR